MNTTERHIQMRRRDERHEHNRKMLALLHLGPIPYTTDADGRLTADWDELARRMGMANAAEVLQFFIDLAWNEDCWIVDGQDRPQST